LRAFCRSKGAATSVSRLANARIARGGKPVAGALRYRHSRSAQGESDAGALRREETSINTRTVAGREAHRADACASVVQDLALATRVDEPGLGSSADGESEEGIERGLERASASMHLGEQKPSLEGGEQSSGEVVRVDVGRELPVGMKGLQSIADGG
jgi:hypothetical protein